ncbi:MAG: thiamine phosphate synthase [Phycisphaerales bacterium]|nr:thiamine phosphate synthase [Phycisphaerales bacterium]
MIVLITPEVDIPNEINLLSHILLNTHISRVHIRKPHKTVYEIDEYITRLPENCYAKISVHHQLGLARKYKLGLHVGLSNGNEEEWANIHPLSVSTHKIEELYQINQLTVKYNYAFISPVFDSISKQGYIAGKSLLDAGNLPRNYNLIALGGIDIFGIPTVKKYGFDGVAVLGAVWHTNQPIEAIESIVDCWNNKG